MERLKKRLGKNSNIKSKQNMPHFDNYFFFKCERRWKILPWYIRFQRIRDSYIYTAKYYDKPDGQDLMGKLVAVNRPALQYGLLSGLSYSFMHSKPADWQTHTGRVLYFVWPFMTAATSFAAVTYFSTKIRQKDD